ncbi:tripartite tricarboxylate transporter TctB family protein [Ancylobacter terrae]|uniref:tripartite tricarboxylate transporter TctB family protein n=1 Tax=Ancylobacter sp. sgz301288 TaxID=3342077 RepID=UPI00385C1B84
MSRRAQENTVLLIIIALFIAMIWASLDYVPRARLVPLPVATIGLVLALMQLAWQNLRSTDDLHVDALQLIAGRAEAGGPTPDAAGAEPPKPRAKFADEVAGFAIVAVVTTAFFVFGLLPTTFVFCATYLILSRQSSPVRALLIAAVFTAMIWFVFGEVLGIRIDRSLIAPWVDRWLG